MASGTVSVDGVRRVPFDCVVCGRVSCLGRPVLTAWKAIANQRAATRERKQIWKATWAKRNLEPVVKLGLSQRIVAPSHRHIAHDNFTSSALLFSKLLVWIVSCA